MRRLIDFLLGRHEPDPGREGRGADLARLTEDHASSMRRVEKLVRLARIDAEILAQTAHKK